MGFTLLELCVVVLAIAGLTAWALTRLHESNLRNRKNPLQCQDNLKFIGVALFDFANEHEEKFPWEVPASKGGSREALASGQAAPHFLCLTNTLRNTRVFLCPMDPMRHRATKLERLEDSAISYFLNVAAVANGRNVILAGDRTLSPGDDCTTGELTVSSQSGLKWTYSSPDEPGHATLDTHEPTGNLLFNNSSLIETTTPQLNRLLRTSLGTNIHRFILP